ncbi:MAG: ATP-binding protein [Methylohalobius sp. ZOD2]|nr:sensor histidine kinase [Methylothermaceae bacterium]
MKRGSLSLRLLLAAGLVLAAFFGLTGIALERAFRDSAHKAMQDQLQVHIYALLSAIDVDRRGYPRLPQHLPDARFSNPGSGLYGFIFKRGRTVWRSPSALGQEIPPRQPASGEVVFLHGGEERDLWILYYGVTWETVSGPPFPLVLAVAADADSLAHQVDDFSRTLWMWLGGSGIFLLIFQAGILRWSLRPLHTISADLEAIEAGRKERLEGTYPRELNRLAANLNALLHSGRTHLERYRNTLADLAHSLKTPLAVLRGLGQNEPLPDASRALLIEQVDRMQMLVDYQLQRAAARGGHGTLRPVAVWPVLERIRAGLDKVYVGKNLHCALEGDREAQSFLEEGDLYELAGNLMENAYKWCRGRVRVQVATEPADAQSHPELHLVVEDDGTGIPETRRSEVLKRGIRADQSTQGHGIGMAVVHELVRLHRGTLRYRESRWGGACWEVVLPSPI